MQQHYDHTDLLTHVFVELPVRLAEITNLILLQVLITVTVAQLPYIIGFKFCAYHGKNFISQVTVCCIVCNDSSS